MAQDMFGQEIEVDAYVCCASLSASTGMYIAKVTKVTEHKLQCIALNGSKHMKAHNKVFVVTEQINTVPELMI